MKTRLKAAGFALVGGLLGYLMQPAPTQMVVPKESTTKTVVEVIRPVPVPVPGPTRTIVKLIEKEPTPRPTDCLVMRWTR